MEQQLGPFEIVKIVSSNVIKLKLPASFRIHDVINVRSEESRVGKECA